MTDPAPFRSPPVWCYLLLNALAAVWLAFSSIHAHHNSDSLVSSLSSLYAWTPYFWHQDRVGMFVPLLTSVCSDPMGNLILQTGIMAFAGLCLPLALAELIYPHPVGRLAETLANVTMLAFSSHLITNTFLLEYYYPLAMSLGCTGLLVLRRGSGWPSWWRVVGSAVCLGVACWVYIGLPIWLGPLALVRAWLQPGEPWPGFNRSVFLRPLLHARSLIGLASIVATFLVNYLLIQASQHERIRYRATPTISVPQSDWVKSWRAFWNYVQELHGTTTWESVAVGMAVLGQAATLALRVRPGYPIVRAAIILLIPAAIEVLFMGTRHWPALNGHHPRYVLGALESVQLTFALLTALPLARIAAERGRWLCFGIAAAALFCVIADRYGFPSASRPRHEIDIHTGRWTAPLLAADVDALGGDYWSVWPTLFHTNMVLRERGERRCIIAVSYRGRPLLERWDWSSQPVLRVAVRKDRLEFKGFLHGIELCGLAIPEKIGETDLFEIYAVYPLKPYR